MRRVAPWLLVWLALAAPASGAAPDIDQHVLTWFVHVDLIDAGAGRDLAYFQALVDDTMAAGSDQLAGSQGPFDEPCCTDLRRSVPVSTFGSPGDGLDVIDVESEYTTLAGIGLPGSRAFLVDSITTCGGPAPNAIGCATTPFCDGDGSDDPNLWMVVTVDAEMGGALVNTTIHERGHNACLLHVDVDECQIMRPAVGGGCLTASECSDYRDGRTTTVSGGSCECQDTSGALEPDWSACPAGGLCSGGVCGDAGGDAQVLLMASGGPESAETGVTDDPLRHSGLSGGWVDLGDFDSPSTEVSGLAYADDRQTLYGIVPDAAGDDDIVTIDVVTGAITGTVLSRANGAESLVALAYDPGPTASGGDDRLWALETSGSFEDLYAVDLSVPSIGLVGLLDIGVPGGFRGLAYDSVNAVLYTTTGQGLYTIDDSCPGFCTTVLVPGFLLPRIDTSLAYSAATQQLYFVSTQPGVAPLGRDLLYEVIDANTLSVAPTIGIDTYRPGGLAAIPLPEPGGAAPPAAALGLVAWLGRRRRARRARRA